MVGAAIAVAMMAVVMATIEKRILIVEMVVLGEKESVRLGLENVVVERGVIGSEESFWTDIRTLFILFLGLYLRLSNSY